MTKNKQTGGNFIEKAVRKPDALLLFFTVGASQKRLIPKRKSSNRGSLDWGNAKYNPIWLR